MSKAAAGLAARYGTGTAVPESWNATLDLLLSHRSVRHYLPQPLPPGALQAAIAAAQSASTSSNLQLWSVIAVEDEGRKQRLSALAAHQRHVAKAPLLLVWLLDLARLHELGEARGEATEGLDYLEGFLLGATDVALAAQNAMVALESLGLGACYIGGMRNQAEAVAAELKLPPRVFALFGMTVGVPDPARAEEVKPRLPQKALVFREEYAGTVAQDIAAYDETLKAFQRHTGMTVADWSEKSVARVRDAKALTGRDVLRGFLARIGFELR